MVQRGRCRWERTSTAEVKGRDEWVPCSGATAGCIDPTMCARNGCVTCAGTGWSCCARGCSIEEAPAKVTMAEVSLQSTAATAFSRGPFPAFACNNGSK